ncbi:MAG: hypothetical protein P8O03_07975 [Ilumatobacter sp.]|nr:hypothetical protein [Ilumatobacter sp.]MDG2040234.1 hypothetical protein [Ilumatobacter sp.]
MEVVGVDFAVADGISALKSSTGVPGIVAGVVGAESGELSKPQEAVIVAMASINNTHAVFRWKYCTPTACLLSGAMPS